MLPKAKKMKSHIKDEMKEKDMKSMKGKKGCK